MNPSRTCSARDDSCTKAFWDVDEAGEDRRRGLGHRPFARRRLRCSPRQDDHLAQSKLELVGEPLAALVQGLGQ
jgi:hypothetical protein